MENITATKKVAKETITEVFNKVENTFDEAAAKVEEHTARFDEEFAQLQSRNRYFRNIPWVAFAALFTVLCCGGAVALTLGLSDGKTEGEWIPHVTPNVLVTVFNGISTIMLGIAISQGVAINWWRQVLKGSTIKDLHRSWSFASSIVDLVLSGKYFNLIALASLTAKFAIIDGVLFQRSLSTEGAYESQAVLSHYDGYNRTTFPYTGYLDSTGHATSSQNSDFTWLLYDYLLYPNMIPSDSMSIEGCPDLCEGNITGVGFAWTCESTTEQVDYGLQASKYFGTNRTDMFQDLVLFSSSFGENLSDTNSTLTANFVWTTTDETSVAKSYGSCPATRTSMNCTLIPVELDYVMSYQDTTMSEKTEEDIYEDPGNTYFSPASDWSWHAVGDDGSTKEDTHLTYFSSNPIIKPIAVKENLTAGAQTRLGGFYIGLETIFSSSMNMSYTGDSSDGGFYTKAAGALSHQVIDGIPDPTTCDFTVSNPAYYVNEALTLWTAFISFNNITFASDYNWTTFESINDDMSYFKVETMRWPLSTKYLVNWYYFIGGILSMLTCVACILPTFWGYWELSRKVSLGPFEIAHAFGAPMLVENNKREHNGEVRILLKDIGKTRVQLTSADGSARVVVTENAAGQLQEMGLKEGDRVTGMMVTDRQGHEREVRPMTAATGVTCPSPDHENEVKPGTAV